MSVNKGTLVAFLVIYVLIAAGSAYLLVSALKESSESAIVDSQRGGCERDNVIRANVARVIDSQTKLLEAITDDDDDDEDNPLIEATIAAHLRGLEALYESATPKVVKNAPEMFPERGQRPPPVTTYLVDCDRAHPKP